MRIVVLGLSITSSWGNGHATTYRGLVRELCARGHEVLFLERDVPWYAQNRDLPRPPYGRTELYRTVDDLRARFARDVAAADVCVVGSYVPDGIEVGTWVQDTARGLAAFYDIDTPVTLAALERGDAGYLAREQVPRYGLYLSFTGGPTLRRLEREFGSPCARALYCSVDAERYRPRAVDPRWDLGYLGTYAADRQPALGELLCVPARAWPDGRFAVAGPQYPADTPWPANVTRIDHVAPPEHPAFYAAQRYTLNLTRADMRAAGWSPSVRLFEAAACGTPLISDRWPGLDALFEPGREILLADEGGAVLEILLEFPESERRRIADRARHRVLAEHTAARRAAQFEAYVAAVAGGGVRAEAV